MKLIDKEKVVAEINGRINEEIQRHATDLGYSQGCVDSMRSILSFLDTLEVKEVDLSDRKTNRFSISKHIESVRDMYDKGVVDYKKFLEVSTFYNGLTRLLKHESDR